MQATDISAPQIEAKLGGKMTTLRFDHQQMRMSELYYQTTTLRKLGYLGIIDQAINGTYIGLGAIAYGAAASADIAANRMPVDMRRFDQQTSYDELRVCKQQLINGIMESLPKPPKNG